MMSITHRKRANNTEITDEYIEFKRELKELILRKYSIEGLTQEEIAAELNCSPGFIWKICHGHQKAFHRKAELRAEGLTEYQISEITRHKPTGSPESKR